MNKALEPGCLVVILRGNMANCVGVALERVPAGQPIITHPDRTIASEQQVRMKADAWEVDLTSDPDVTWTVLENNLMRIDGGDFDASLEQHQDQEVPSHANA